jgi:hypothetical protein
VSAVSPDSAILIHLAAPGDADVARLAVLDSTTPREGPALVAVADGEARAALFLDDGSAVADPFFPSAPLVELLRVYRTSSPSGASSTPRRPASDAIAGMASAVGRALSL